MSLGEMGELYSTLQEIDVMLTRIEVKSQSLKGEFGHAKGELREFEYILYRVTALLGRLGLPPDVQRAISLMQRMILVARMLHSAMMLLESTTPYGWILAGISLATTAVVAGQTGYDLLRGT